MSEARRKKVSASAAHPAFQLLVGAYVTFFVLAMCGQLELLPRAVGRYFHRLEFAVTGAPDSHRRRRNAATKPNRNLEDPTADEAAGRRARERDATVAR